MDNTLSFSAGTIVDCAVMGVGVAHVTISEGGSKVTVTPNITGTFEEFDKFGKLPVFWNFNFKLSSEFASKAGVATVGHLEKYSLEAGRSAIEVAAVSV